MRWGINLRGDLAKLDDAGIASMFEKLMQEREALYQRMSDPLGEKWLYQKGIGMIFGRGLLHARIFYRLYGFTYRFSSFPFTKRPHIYDLYLLDCELRDIQDELRRRLKQKRRIGLAT